MKDTFVETFLSDTLVNNAAECFDADIDGCNGCYWAGYGERDRPAILCECCNMLSTDVLDAAASPRDFVLAKFVSLPPCPER